MEADERVEAAGRRDAREERRVDAHEREQQRPVAAERRAAAAGHPVRETARRQMRGDVLHNPGLGYALAMGMVVIMAVSILAYALLQRRSERWLR